MCLLCRLRPSCSCVTTALFWAATPIWLPAYCLTVPTFKISRAAWRKHIGPLTEASIPQPVSKNRKPRRAISKEALDKEYQALAVVDEKPKPKIKNECGFWKLPIELRLMIWKELLLLEYDGFVEIQQASNRRNRLNLFTYDCYRRIDARVLAVDRKFYLEGADILYRQNEFRMRQEAALISFSRRVSPSRLAMITTLQFQIYHDIRSGGPHRRSLTFNSHFWKEACKGLELFTGLKSLKIGMNMDLGPIARRCFREPEWCQDFFSRIFDPLSKVKIAKDGEFLVGYTWDAGICDEWPTGEFTMQQISSSLYWW